MSVTVESLHEQGRSALLEGQVRPDVPPAPGARRWGLSVLVRPQPDLAARVAELTSRLATLAGPGQWATGSAGSAHLTVYSLEPHRPGVTLADPAARRYADAMRQAAAATEPGAFAVTGLSLTPGGVIAACEPQDAGARALRPTLTAALGGTVFEAAYRGDQWWMSLLHLAAQVTSPGPLVDHVARHRDAALGTLVVQELELVRYEYRTGPEGAGMRPVTLASAPLTGGTG